MARRVTYEDSKGRKYLVDIPDDAPDSHAKLGAPVGPPDLKPLNLPLQIEVRLNNQLYDRGLFAKEDLRHRRAELFAALQAALSIDVNVLDSLFEGVLANAS